MRSARTLLSALLVAFGLVAFAGCETQEDTGGGEPAAAEAPDSGRMDDGEYGLVSSAVEDLDGEISDYRSRVTERCVALVRNFEAAAAQDCIDEAYDGVEGSAGNAYATLDDLRSDTGGACRKALSRATALVNTPLYRALEASHRGLVSLDGDAITAVAGALNREDNRWNAAAARMLDRCSPQ